MQQKIKLILVICINLLILTDLPMQIQRSITEYKNNIDEIEGPNENNLTSEIFNQITESIVYILITLIFYKLY